MPSPPPPVLIATLFAEDDFAELFENAEQTRIVYALGKGEENPPDLSGVPEFNALCVSLPDDLLGQYQAFEVALRFIEARRPWILTLTSGSPIPWGFAERVQIETEGLGYDVRSNDRLDRDSEDGSGFYALIGTR